ncbi:hypothetical protein SASPL_101015 [Salvia splendens]|uniref:RING-type E3 ubiquitin transferase n=1 Tax=Salvia splendens TaxID=180675 RepID=A0A8X8YPB7_SALSN|nr:hypothetical protein SASPL_101015 [Salvia splendens]
MNPVTCRRLLQPNNGPTAAASPRVMENSAAAMAAAYKRQLDSSIALTIIVLLTAFFFIGLVSFLIRRSSAEARPDQEGGAAEAVTSLPLVTYTQQQMMEECPICLSEFEEGETVKLIPYCGHVFHAKCVDTWLHLHVTCPLCRSDQLFKQS